MSYPLQYFRIAIGDTDNNIVASDSSLSPSVQKGTSNEKWYVNYKSENVFQIVNVSNNQLMTGSGNNVSLSNNSNLDSQNWKIEGVDKDYDGYYLYYKITNNGDSSKSLTYTANSGFSLSNYSGGNYQKFKLNLDGLEGFAANCKTSSGEKAGTIGGLLGPVVEVNTKEELINELNSVDPKTIVLNANVDLKYEKNTRIRDNKTLVGSFKYHTIYDCRLRSSDSLGKDEPSDNIILRNLDFEARDDGDRILLSFYSSRQIWIDHVNFNNTISYDRKGNGQDGIGKFIWINTTTKDKPDGKDINRSPDYITISYCRFTNKYWCFAYGTQSTEITRDRTTLLFNWWNKNVRRCPQLGNGSCHVYNNYYEAYGQKDNGGATSGIIGGDGSDMVSENNMFNGYSLGQALMMGGDGKNPARDDNSYISNNLNGTPGKCNYSSKKQSTWYPNKSNYGYHLIEPYNNNNTDTKAFCTKYTGCFNSQNEIKYITDIEFSNWIKTTYSSPFLKHADFDGGSNPPIPDSDFKDGTLYKIKNVNSNLYMQVTGAVAENGTKIQQWGTMDGTTHDVWKIKEAGDGYYFLIPGVGNGNTYALDVSEKSKENGAGMVINEYNGDTSQQFYFEKNSDGSYIIKTRITDNNSAVEIKDAGTGSGDLVQQWQLNGQKWQNWIFEQVSSANASIKLFSKKEKSYSVTKTKVYKDNDCVHTVIFVK